MSSLPPTVCRLVKGSWMSQEGVLAEPRVVLRDVPKQRSTTKRALRMLRRGRLGLAGCIVLLIVVIAAIAAPWIAPYKPSEGDVLARLYCPAHTSCPRYGTQQTIHGTTAHWLGTDYLGR